MTDQVEMAGHAGAAGLAGSPGLAGAAGLSGSAGHAGAAGPSDSDESARARRWAIAAAVAADERKGVDTVIIDVGDVLVVTDLFVITHGNNARQVRSIAEGVVESLKAAGGPSVLRIEGADERQWVLLDYGAFVVHVFDAERRALYQLERLWGDCGVVEWRSSVDAASPATTPKDFIAS